MELPSKDDKNTVIDKKVKTQETTVKVYAQKQKNTSEKTRPGFWSRLKNYTVEPPKTVIIENGVEKLVLILPETTAAPKTVVIKEETQKPVSVPPKTTVVKEKVERKPLPSSDKLKKGLEKTRGRFWSRLRNFFSFQRKIDESVLEELEDILIGADIGAKPVQKLIHELHEAWKSQTITETSQIHDFIKNKLKEDLRSWQTSIHYAPNPPTVIMVVGVNGVGKTTAIAKLANILIKDGKKVLVAAGDTFRAAAVDQLDIWSKRIGAEIVKHQTGSDPAAVAYDAIEAAIARGIHVVIVDTAGRLHTHENLMGELSKIKRVISKRIPGAPHEVLMVLDATTGQNAISQAKMFKQAVDVTGIFLAKLDGTAKGGIVLGMRNEINIPVKFVGLGETADDIEKFDADTFVNALFE
ncbi:MAG TPA: signal recognition particle-docking protein FtsY [Candidatus Brocadiaceae bacterium]|nr:signal recognition particle-docking protein FtsY [Candidatus Brocadiaceae bacterium]